MTLLIGLLTREVFMVKNSEAFTENPVGKLAFFIIFNNFSPLTKIV